MSLPHGVHRHVRGGRSFYTKLTAWYRIRFDGDSAGWWAVIRHRDTDRFIFMLDIHSRPGQPATLEAIHAAASAWIKNQQVPA